MGNWYCSREAVKLAGNISGDDRHRQIDPLIEAGSREFDRLTRRFYIPRTETRKYTWPNRRGSGLVLYLDQDLISVTTLQTKAEDATPTTISSDDFFVEPVNFGPPFDRVEIDLSSAAAFEAGATRQRSISIEGSWGFGEDTKSTGTIDDSGGISDSDTALIISDASLIEVGFTLLIESEQVFVSNRSFAALGSILIDGVLTANMAENVTADSSHGILGGEVIRVDSEQMLVLSVSGTTLTVIRGYNGSILASHSNDTAIHINRTLSIERGANGTTAAAHDDSKAISAYEPPFDVVRLVLGEVLASYAQQGALYGRSVGTGEGATEFASRDLSAIRSQTIKRYRRVREAAI